MYYPAQTSLIPVSVALARFVESHGFGAATYPYWYLGAPLHYLTGPVVPGLLVLSQRLVPGLSYFDLSYWWLFVSLAIGALGWGGVGGQIERQSRKGNLDGRFVFSLALEMAFHFGDG